MLIDGSGLESFGLFRTIVDTYGPQTVVGPYGLLLRGLAFNISEQWAPSFTAPINGWTQSFATPTNTWTGFTLPVTVWTGM